MPFSYFRTSGPADIRVFDIQSGQFDVFMAPGDPGAFGVRVSTSRHSPQLLLDIGPSQYVVQPDSSLYAVRWGAYEVKLTNNGVAVALGAIAFFKMD